MAKREAPIENHQSPPEDDTPPPLADLPPLSAAQCTRGRKQSGHCYVNACTPTKAQRNETRLRRQKLSSRLGTLRRLMTTTLFRLSLSCEYVRRLLDRSVSHQECCCSKFSFTTSETKNCFTLPYFFFYRRHYFYNTFLLYSTQRQSAVSPLSLRCVPRCCRRQPC